MMAEAAMAALSVDAVVGDLPGHAAVVPAETTGQAVAGRLEAEPTLPGIIVLRGAALLGVLSRVHFAERLARPFGREVFLSRPITTLMTPADAAPLCVPAGMPLAEAARLALARPAAQAYAPLVVMEAGGGLRLLDAQVVFQAMTRVLTLHVQVKEGLLAELSNYAARLETTLEELRRTQEELVRNGKMAALGNLVAGIAHEINTPLGIARTGASHLADVARRFGTTVESGRLGKAELQRFLATIQETTGLLETNTRRAAELISSFKRVAVDHTSSERRRFDLAGYIREVLVSLGPGLTKTPHSVSIQCPEGLDVDSHPGALWQILTNLVMNAVTHAFDQTPAGHITITGAETPPGTIELSVSDDGSGIAPEHLGRIFDPFFTTRRSAGGSGLGLHLVYNLAAQTLRGSIAVRSEPGRGTTFTLRFPRVLPAEDRAA